MDTFTDIGYLASATRFRRISERLYLDGDKIYERAGIHFKASWFPVFYVISKSEQPIAVLEIADQIDFSHISVKNVVNALSNEGLVIISENPTDRRSKLIVLSEKGKLALGRLGPIWQSFAKALKETFETGHPDILSILDRIDVEIDSNPIVDRLDRKDLRLVKVIDYKPALRGKFYELVAPWLRKVLKEKLEDEDNYTLHHPEDAFLKTGGFMFFAKLDMQIVGCVVLKRLDGESFELAKLFVDQHYRALGIATRLIERCVSRCRENEAKELWLQTMMSEPQTHQLYDKMGFIDEKPPPQMNVLRRTQKTMCKKL